MARAVISVHMHCKHTWSTQGITATERKLRDSHAHERRAGNKCVVRLLGSCHVTCIHHLPDHVSGQGLTILEET